MFTLTVALRHLSVHLFRPDVPILFPTTLSVSQAAKSAAMAAAGGVELDPLDAFMSGVSSVDSGNDSTRFFFLSSFFYVSFDCTSSGGYGYTCLVLSV